MSSENRSNAVNRQLAAILFADIVGYTALMQKGEATALKILNRFQDISKDKVSQYEGEIIKTYGDGSIILFTSTINAVQCAKEMQMAFKEEPTVPLRIGIHIGEIVRKDKDVFGNGVNVSARIESMGVAGAVLLSDSAYAKVKNQEDLEFESLGEYEFKNVEEPIEVFALSNDKLVVPDISAIEGKFKGKAIITDSDESFFQRIWKKKIPQLTTLYFIGGWALLQMSNWALNHFRVSPRWSEILFILIVGMIPSILVYFNNRDRIHGGEFRIGEKILFPANFLAVGTVIFFLFQGADLGAMTRTINYVDEDGNQVSRTMVKKDYLIRLPVFPFEQINPDSSTVWVSDVLHFAFHLDLAQDDNLAVGRERVPAGSENEFPTRSEKIEMSKSYGGKYYIDGKYDYDGEILELRTSLRNGSNGNLIDERSFKGTNILELIDSSSAYMRVAIGLSKEQIDAYVDQDVAETFTNNLEALRLFSQFIRGRGIIKAVQAVELDSTFAYASYRISRNLYFYSAGDLEVIRFANQAYRHRKRMPPQDQIAINTHKYLAEKNYDKAEDLLKLQLEMNPNGDTRAELFSLYSRTDQREKYLALAKQQFEDEG
ncbi:MAG: adenylate/guanylate cyclase domain-containing protein, partial [Bacteroidia bacterium]|nr:adenylate/guanylate cyclase domain-containing protein [Bacteroidia bacterium]